MTLNESSTLSSRQFLAAVCVVMCLALDMASVRADEVVFKTGRTMEGVIIRHTTKFLVLNVGVGEMQIQSNQIKKVVLGTRADNDRIRAAWKKSHYLNSAYVPKGLEPLSRSFSALQDSRQSAIDARSVLARVGQDEVRLPNEISDLRQQIQGTASRLSRAPTNTFDDVNDYNRLVMENNGLVTQLNAKAVEYQGLDSVRRKAQGIIATYMGTLDAFEADLRTQRAAHGKDSQQAAFFLTEIEKTVAGYQQDFSRVSVPTAGGEAGGHLVDVRINGRDAGRFIIDTGAAIITLSRAAADRLRIDTTHGRPSEMIMADGRKVAGVQVILGSVQVGSATVENVPAVIMPGTIGQDSSGLLGMSFLRNFNMSLDGSTGNLVLKEFTPR